jgi:N-acetylmuramoyl-L-alanine amidase
VHLVFSSGPNSELEPFAPEGPPGPRAIHSIVLDPGHGGSDAGVTAGGLKEKELTLALARLLKVELERRGPVRVVLTRDDDREIGEAERAEHANRARADLVLALHFDGLPGSRAHGVTAYCPPATFGTRQRNAQALIALLPWRDVGLRHAVAARELAENVLSSIELRAQGPVRLREVLPYPLLGVNAPGLLLECATLTSEADRARLQRPNGLAELAATIADGIQAYQRNE